MKGKKFDQDKIPLEIMPFEALEEVAKVMSLGAKKYGRHNWRGGMLWSRLAGASLRHVFSWLKGDDKDPETGLSHLAHAACCLLFLITYELQGLGEDDRYVRDK